jgi:hypothetical protein
MIGSLKETLADSRKITGVFGRNERDRYSTIPRIAMPAGRIPEQENCKVPIIRRPDIPVWQERQARMPVLLTLQTSWIPE